MYISSSSLSDFDLHLYFVLALVLEDLASDWCLLCSPHHHHHCQAGCSAGWGQKFAQISWQSVLVALNYQLPNHCTPYCHCCTDLWKFEWVTRIRKIAEPQDRGDLRNLSLTLFISKLCEKNIIYDLLLSHWGHKIDSAQYGGRAGYSVTLYLIKLVDFILSNLDKSKAIIMCLIDFSKAYNRQCHNRLLTCYSDLGTPSFLLKILHSYLQNRRMRVRHKGETSKTYDLPGSGPQGTNIGILSFVVYLNSCGVPLDGMLDCIFHEHKEQYLGHPVQENEDPPMNSLGWVKICHPILPIPNPHINEDEARFKYVDDKVMAEAVDLNKLKTFNEPIERPLNYRDRTAHYLPKELSILQTRFLQVSKFCKVQQMIVNPTKSKTAIFNTSIKKDFYPRISINEDNTFENTEEFKLLGVNFVSHPRSGVKWDPYISKCIQRIYQLVDSQKNG